MDKEPKVNYPLKQTKLPVVLLDDMKNYGFNTVSIPKPG